MHTYMHTRTHTHTHTHTRTHTHTGTGVWSGFKVKREPAAAGPTVDAVDAPKDDESK